MSNSNSNNITTTPLVALVGGMVVSAAAAAASATYLLTKRSEEQKRKSILARQVERDRLLKLKTAEAREKRHLPPSGTLLSDIVIEQVYLWECEDLRKKFPSALVENSKMMGKDHEAYGLDTKYSQLVTDHEVILADILRKPNMHTHTVAHVRAGPRKLLHFDPKKVNAAIVTCGGLCPGLNNVVRDITRTLHQSYGIGGKVYGIRSGYKGFYDPKLLPPIELTPEYVSDIHHDGGTVLGTSRGGFDREKILAFLKKYNISQLYVIGGDGTHRGAYYIHEGCIENGMNVSVVGIPKTIDNDIDYIDHSFGFNTAIEAAQAAIQSAKVEASCFPNGVGIVKLMGREAGFLAAFSTMSSSDVDLCLVPEVPIVLDGPKGCLPHIFRRVNAQGHAVVVVAEGAGEELVGSSSETDLSGNKILMPIGEFMAKEVKAYFKALDEPISVKYIDPSYTVRSVPANAADSLYCMQLGQNAVHGAMAGYTGFSTAMKNSRMVFIPIPELVSTSPRSLDPYGRTWERVVAITRQPNTVEPLPDGISVRDSHAPMLR